MTALDVADFAQYFADVHDGRAPFPWQEQLTAEVMSSGQWPAIVDVPTGLGKTSMVDIAVFVLAAAEGTARIAARRRTFFVVDRRLVVDEAFDHARKLSEAIGAAQTDVLKEVRQRLLALLGHRDDHAQPITVTRMRGGATWDSSWVDRPDQAAIVVGTVDQVGSRMLFRGYATTDYRKPMDAALVGTDSLILVDEAHLAQPLLSTLSRLQELDPPRLPIPHATVVELTATPRAAGERYPFDVEAHLHVPAARARLEASKRLHLAVAEPKRIAESLSTLTLELLADRPGARALVVCNTVSVARKTHSAIIGALPKSSCNLPTQDGRVVTPELLIGRARPIDRDVRTALALRRFGVDRTHDLDACVDVLVATQTVEVGANLDVDVLVTESAPLGALVQRLGRLNRLGRSAIEDPIAVVVDDGSDDFIYGQARRNAWHELLKRVGTARVLNADMPAEWHSLQADPLALRTLASDCPADAFAGEAPIAPMLHRPIVRSWARTFPRPEPDTPVGPYLHGLASGPEPITVFWRSDLVDDDQQTWDARLRSMPFTSAEAIELPLAAALAWMNGAPEQPLADVDASLPAVDAKFQVRQFGHVAVRSGDLWLALRPDQIRPGDVVALPASRGGLDEFGWDPGSRGLVKDVRDIASLWGRRPRPTLRIDDHTCANVFGDAHPSPRAGLAHLIEDLRRADQDADSAISDQVERVVDLVQSLAVALDDDEISCSYRELITQIVEAGPIGVELIELRRAGQSLLRVRASNQFDAAGDDGSMSSSAGAGKVTLAKHHAAVAARAGGICAALRIPDEVAELVVFAAEHHDLGKIDVRFQAALTDGSTFMAELIDEPLAKSGHHPYSTAARDARRRANLPRGFRHEAWSAVLAEQLLPGAGRPAWHGDLVKHLVASHHGRGRPLLPPVIDKSPKTLTVGEAEVITSSELSVDLEAVTCFDSLNSRFGMRGLALLETIVRCADQTCSAEGS